MASDILVVNAAQMNVRTRSGKSSTVITMSVTSEPITYNLNDAFLLRRAADEIARQIREQTKAVQQAVKPATAKARAVAEKAFAAGKPWAVERFAGGRIGTTPPQASQRTAFQHSGRLADSIVAQWVERSKEFFINYASNRWNPKHWPSLAKMQTAIMDWVASVPVLSDPKSDINVQRAFRETHGKMVQKHPMGTSAGAATTRAAAASDADLESLLRASLKGGE